MKSGKMEIKKGGRRGQNKKYPSVKRKVHSCTYKATSEVGVKITHMLLN